MKNCEIAPNHLQIKEKGRIGSKMPPKRKGKVNDNVYEKADDLPEGRKKLYDSILEDFDKQGKQNF